MILATAAAESVADRHLYQGRDGHSAWVTPYFGTEPMADASLPRPPEGTLFPVAFMVEEHANSTLGAHFHRADQFQLFVRGDGRFGNAAITPLSVHLASAFTPYGPICAGKSGLAYLTLRNGFDPGPRYMPQAEAELSRDRTARPHQKLLAIPAIDPSIAEASVPVLDNGPDGWGVWHRRYPPLSAVTSAAVGGGGQYWVISRGSAEMGGRTMDSLSCLFIAPGGMAPSLLSASDGVDIVVLQFPPRPPGTPSARLQ
jgi:hypothetical protein